MQCIDEREHENDECFEGGKSGQTLLGGLSLTIRMKGNLRPKAIGPLAGQGFRTLNKQGQAAVPFVVTWMHG
jgi:hypothetical protein